MKDKKMINEDDAQNLINRLLELKTIAEKTNTTIDKVKLQQHEKICIDKFKYLITMRTGKYKSFNNYDDLNQEGYLALVTAINNYNKDKGSFFWWAHKYIDTRIYRSANTHTTIRYPLKVAKEMTPHKESVMPVQIEEKNCPDKLLEDKQTNVVISGALSLLTEEQRSIVSLAYGINDEKPLSVSKICKKTGISRPHCVKVLNNAVSIMRDNIRKKYSLSSLT